MRKQSGFTLIELMVVMAIIAILATAWLSAYGGYIKKARDTTRIADLSALDTIVQAAMTSNGTAPTLANLKTSIVAMNNGQMLSDPLDGLLVCLNEDKDPSECWYQYISCTEWWYVLGVKFESLSNHYRYTQDELNVGTSPHDDNYFEIWNCDVRSWSFALIRLP